jgi:hypothetical protein
VICSPDAFGFIHRADREEEIFPPFRWQGTHPDDLQVKWIWKSSFEGACL